MYITSTKHTQQRDQTVKNAILLSPLLLLHTHIHKHTHIYTAAQPHAQTHTLFKSPSLSLPLLFCPVSPNKEFSLEFD